MTQIQKKKKHFQNNDIPTKKIKGSTHIFHIFNAAISAVLYTVLFSYLA